MSRFCATWSHHVWVRTDGLDLDRHCSKCGLIEPRPPDRPDPDRCLHQWEAGTFRRICMWCGTVDRERVVGPSRKGQVPAKSGKWPLRVERCFERDGAGCFYCRKPLTVEQARLDHFIPRSRGGPDALANRRAACEKCDVRKKDKMPWEFMPARFAHLRDVAVL